MGRPSCLMSQIMAFLSSLIQTGDRVFNPFDASHMLRGWSLDLQARVYLRRSPLLNAAEFHKSFAAMRSAWLACSPGAGTLCRPHPHLLFFKQHHRTSLRLQHSGRCMIHASIVVFDSEARKLMGSDLAALPQSIALACLAAVYRGPSNHADFATQDFVLERTLGAVGFMNIASVAPSVGAAQESAGLDLSVMQQRASQEVTEGGVSARLYAGCLHRLLTPPHPALCTASGELCLPERLAHMQRECASYGLTGVSMARDCVAAMQAREARQALWHPSGAEGGHLLRALMPADHAFSMLCSTLLCCSMRAVPLCFHLSGTMQGTHMRCIWHIGRDPSA